MMHRLAICLAFLSITTVTPRPAGASAVISVVFDTVDFVEIRTDDARNLFLLVRGIPSGQSTPSTGTFNFGNYNTTFGVDPADAATRCERLALIAMSKPGKYQFGIGLQNLSGGNRPSVDCRLTRVTP